MNILVVGNVIKDVYLNLDSRTEIFESDKDHTKWLNLAFNASEHHFFSRESSLGGSAITLEVLSKMGLNSAISNSNLNFSENGDSSDYAANAHRYILISDGQVTYFSPTNYQKCDFSAPSTAVDYLFIDRSAELDINTAKKISTYLELAQNTKLVLYIRNFNNQNLNRLIPRANLLFVEENSDNFEKIKALNLPKLNPDKIIYISENAFSYQNIIEKVSVKRIDMLTHLSAYSIAAATILGGFILGYSVEKSLKLARINLENSKLNANLSLEELEKLSDSISPENDLELLAANLVLPHKGILAADESGGSIQKKFAKLDIPDTYENRRNYRNIFFSTPDLEKYVNGVILFDETARQFADNGQNFVDYLISKCIIPGIKVDQGLAPLSEITNNPNDSEETYTKGLDQLAKRLKEYYIMGLRFAKWRSAFEIKYSANHERLTPTSKAIEENCHILAKYAKECQSAGLVPIVEPEVVYDGNYPIKECAKVTADILDCLFKTLNDYDVNLKATILKVNMVLAGKQYETQSTPEEVGLETAKVLKEHVPKELAGVVFLSGGQTVEQATDNLSAIIKNSPFPWPVTFSFARALQDPALYAWAGNNENIPKAREAFKERLIKNTEIL